MTASGVPGCMQTCYRKNLLCHFQKPAFHGVLLCILESGVCFLEFSKEGVQQVVLCCSVLRQAGRFHKNAFCFFDGHYRHRVLQFSCEQRVEDVCLDCRCRGLSGSWLKRKAIGIGLKSCYTTFIFFVHALLLSSVWRKALRNNGLARCLRCVQGNLSFRPVPGWKYLISSYECHGCFTSFSDFSSFCLGLEARFNFGFVFRELKVVESPFIDFYRATSKSRNQWKAMDSRISLSWNKQCWVGV